MDYKLSRIRPLYLIAAITTTIILSTQSWSKIALATENEQFCFLTTESGQVIGFSNSLCQSQQSQLNNTNKDEVFIESYKNQAREYDDVRDNLMGNIESSAPEKIEQAKNVCANFKAGISPEESAENLDNNFTPADKINNLIINSLAVKIYCPWSGK